VLIGYDEAVVRAFPTIRAGVVHATGVTNGPSPPALLEEYRAEQRAAAERLEGVAIADLPSIAAWRRVFPRFGVKPTQHRAAADDDLFDAIGPATRLMVGDAERMGGCMLLDQIDRAARSDARVLITGESGTGKEVAARLIHERSRRRMYPLTTIKLCGHPPR